jgi:hypothetical protein
MFTPTGLHTATVRAMGDSVQAVPVDNVTPVPADDPLPIAAAAATLRKQLDPREHRIVTAIGCEDVLFQTLDLPSENAAELRQMLELQIDTITPLPVEEVVYDFMPLAKHDGQTRVLVAVARKDAINERVSALESAGLPPESVTVDAVAVFHALSARGQLPGDTKFNLLLLLSREVANVMVYKDGQPRSVRSVMLDEGTLDHAEGLAALLAELQRTLMSDAAGEPDSETGLLTVLTFDETLRGVCEEMTRAWDGRAEFLNNGSAPTPAMSLCLESAGSTARLNLLPDEWRQKRQTARRRQNLMRAGIAVVFLYLAGLVAFLSWLTIKGNELSGLIAETTKLGPAHTQAVGLHNEFLAMQRQLDPRYTALEFFREVSVGLPGEIELSLFAVKGEKIENKDRKVVRIKGRAKKYDLIHTYESNLRRCEQFESVTEQGRIVTSADGWSSFELICLIKTTSGGPKRGTQ